jgi:hypothetical protein
MSFSANEAECAVAGLIELDVVWVAAKSGGCAAVAEPGNPDFGARGTVGMLEQDRQHLGRDGTLLPIPTDEWTDVGGLLSGLALARNPRIDVLTSIYRGASLDGSWKQL